MDEQTRIDTGMQFATTMWCNKLTDEQFNALLMSALLDTDPRGIDGYQAVKGLYTEQGGTRMHSETKKHFSRPPRSAASCSDTAALTCYTFPRLNGASQPV